MLERGVFLLEKLIVGLWNYYKIKQGVLQQNLSCIYHFDSANTVCDQFNRLINALRKEEEEISSTDKYL